MTTDTRLDEIRHHLEAAVAADLRARRRQQEQVRTKLAFPWRSRVLAAAVAALAIGAPSVAIASGLFNSASVAASLPAGTRFLIGSNPTCTVVTTNVEYHCTLGSPPVPANPSQTNPNAKGAPSADPALSGIAAGQFKGNVEDTVDATHHVNGGCRATTADGSQWDCYLGQAAVIHDIIGAQLLGQLQTAPGVG